MLRAEVYARKWIAIAKDRSKWRQLTHSIPKPPDA